MTEEETGDRRAGAKTLAITALVLGILGLFTAGGFGIGSLLGLVLAAAALLGPSPRAGRDVAWAALAANVVALFTILPVAAGYWAYRQTPVSQAADDDALPQPHQRPAFVDPLPEAPPPPPPRLAELQTPSPPPRRAVAAKPSVRVHPRDPASAPTMVTPATPAAATEAAPTAPVRIGEGGGGQIREPRKTRDVRPVYPKDALAARIQGVVVLECRISPEGKVVEVKVLRGVSLLDEAAITAVRQWEYTPTLLNGVPVPVIMTVSVNFRLS